MAVRRGVGGAAWGEVTARQHPGVLVAAGLGVLVGLAFPLIAAGPRAAEVLPAAIVGCVLGTGIALAALTFLRPSLGMIVAIVVMFVAMFVLQRIGGAWPAAIPPYVLGTFGGAVLGGALRRRLVLRRS